MARKPKSLDNPSTKAKLDGMIADAISFDGSERKGRRESALAYQAGQMPDLPPMKDRSSVVEQVLSDTMGMLLPAVMRVFLASDRIAIYDPVPPAFVHGVPQHEFEAECQRVQDAADQATDYVNFVFLHDCAGEKLLRDAIYDGFLHGNGIIKHWWDPTPEHKIESYTNLTDDEYLELVSDPDVEVLEHSEKPDESAAGMPLLGLGQAQVAGQSPLVGSASDQSIRTAGQQEPTPGVPSAPPPAAAGGGYNPLPMAGNGGLPPSPPPGPMAAGAVGVGGPPPAGAVPNPSVLPQMAAGAGAPGVGNEALGIGPAGGAFPPLPAFAGIGGNFPPPAFLHDVKLRRVISTGRLRIKTLAGEDFLIEANATALNEDECRFCAHLDTPTRSQLIERGYDKDIVFNLGSVTEDSTDSVRRGNLFTVGEDYEDKSGERVQVYECYALLDPDEDGRVEWYQIIVGGPAGSSEILSITEWGGKLPFSEIVPDPIPHVWQARSLYDQLRDPQRVATALTRRVNDNLYMVVEPQRAVDMRMVENPDAVFDVQLGGVIRTKGDPRQAIMDLATPFVGESAMQMVQEQRHIAERRVGVGEQSAGLDVNALTNQVATAVNATQSASAARKEEYCRNIARGVKRVFSSVLQLMVENQDRPRVIALRGSYVEMNPQGWSADMDLTVNTGLGSGNRDRDLAMLQGILAEQKVILQTLGPDNPLCGVKEYFTTLRMMVEAAGVKGAERFFPDVTDEMLAQMRQAAQQKAQQPDPKAAAAQAQLQIAQQKAQSDAQLGQAKAQADAQLQAAKAQQAQQIAEAKLQADMRVREAEMQHRMEMDRAKAQQDLATAQAKAQAEIQVQQAKQEMQLQMMQQKAAADLELRTRELQLEYQLKAQQQAAGVNVQHTTDLEMPQ